MIRRLEALEQALKDCVTEEGSVPTLYGPLRRRILTINEIARKALEPPPKPKGPTEGWVTLMNSKKFHYVRDGKTLCGRFMYLGNAFQPDQGKPIPDDCAECSRRLKKGKT